MEEIAGTDAGFGQVGFAQAFCFAQNLRPDQRGMLEEAVSHMLITKSKRPPELIKA